MKYVEEIHIEIKKEQNEIYKKYLPIYFKDELSINKISLKDGTIYFEWIENNDYGNAYFDDWSSLFNGYDRFDDNTIKIPKEVWERACKMQKIREIK